MHLLNVQESLYIKKRWELRIKCKGRCLDKELFRIILPNKEQIKWKVKNNCIERIRISKTKRM